MKRLRIYIAILPLFFTGIANAQAHVSGDIWRWIPFDSNTSAKNAQIVRNAQYVSVRIAAAHVSYKSGFLENIRQIVVSSSVSFDLSSQKVQALNINRTWQKTANNSDDDIPVNDLLAVLSPATPNSISIKVQFAGIGQDRFKSIFDILSGNDVKTVLNLSPAAIAESNLATSILQKFLASPYTSSNPRDVLSLSQGFVIYPDNTAARVDSLKQGYIVVISGTEKRTADLNNILNLGPDALRFDQTNHVLETRGPNGSWPTFTGNSYVVLSVTTDSVRGIDENSAWFKKFSDAKQTAQNPLTGGETAENAKTQALSLWRDGVALLAADPDYIEAERTQIYRTILANIEQNTASLDVPGDIKAAANIDNGFLQMLATTNSESLANLQDVARNYNLQVQQANVGGTATIHVVDPTGHPVSNIEVSLTDVNTGMTFTAHTDQNGDATFNALNQSTYTFQAGIAGFQTFNGAITVEPREAKYVSLKAHD